MRCIHLIISIDDEGKFHVHIDGSHATHANSRVHSGLFVTMGKGTMMNVSKKLGLNTESSTETEEPSNDERFSIGSR